MGDGCCLSGLIPDIELRTVSRDHLRPGLLCSLQTPARVTLTSVKLQTQRGLSANSRRSLGRSGQWWPLLLLQTGNCKTVTVCFCFYSLSDTVQYTCPLWAMSNKVKVWCMKHCYLTQSTGWKYYEVSTHTFYHFDEQAFLSVWKVWTEAVEGQLPRIIKTQIPYKNLKISWSPTLQFSLTLFCLLTVPGCSQMLLTVCYFMC